MTVPSTGPTIREWLDNSVDPSRLPDPLPFNHVAKLEGYEGILRDRALRPVRLDTLFGERLLFMYYGVFGYTPTVKNMLDEAELPFVFYFTSGAASRAARFYPFDTGGLGNRYGQFGPLLIRDLDSYRIDGTDNDFAPRMMVAGLFGDNRNYRIGSFGPAVSEGVNK